MDNEPGFDQHEAPSHFLEGSRRDFLKLSSALVAISFAPNALIQAAENKADEKIAGYFEQSSVTLHINGQPHQLEVEPRATLLDVLREQVGLTGTKKGCDHGQCGACTVHLNGKRINSCLTFAIMQDGQQITTIEGLAQGDALHPLQQAFIDHDGFQCGYCTSGQIMSGAACIREGHAGSKEEIKAYMSGNICRCGAYNNIAAAIAEAKEGGQTI